MKTETTPAADAVKTEAAPVIDKSGRRPVRRMDFDDLMNEIDRDVEQQKQT